MFADLILKGLLLLCKRGCQQVLSILQTFHILLNLCYLTKERFPPCSHRFQLCCTGSRLLPHRPDLCLLLKAQC